MRYRVNGQGRERTFRRYKDAEAVKRKVEADEVAGLVIDQRAGEELFETYAERWLASRRIGHSSPRAALIYQHATEERDRSIAAFLDREIAAAQQALSPANVTPIRIPVWARSGPVVGQSHPDDSAHYGPHPR